MFCPSQWSRWTKAVHLRGKTTKLSTAELGNFKIYYLLMPITNKPFSVILALKNMHVKIDMVMNMNINTWIINDNKFKLFIKACHLLALILVRSFASNFWTSTIRWLIIRHLRIRLSYLQIFNNWDIYISVTGRTSSTMSCRLFHCKTIMSYLNFLFLIYNQTVIVDQSLSLILVMWLIFQWT